MADFNIGDLEFILAQIKIAEQNATRDDGTPGIPLDQLVPNPLLPWGLRTVDGTFNNITVDPDRSTWGSADQDFLRVSNGTSYDAGELFDPDGPGPLGSNPTTYAGPGLVADSEPRTISNLIVDQTLANPAAVAAALKFAGLSGAELATQRDAIVSAYQTTIAPLEAQVSSLRGAATTALATAEAALAAVNSEAVQFVAAQSAVDTLAAAAATLRTSLVNLKTSLFDGTTPETGANAGLPFAVTDADRAAFETARIALQEFGQAAKALATGLTGTSLAQQAADIVDKPGAPGVANDYTALVANLAQLEQRLDDGSFGAAAPSDLASINNAIDRFDGGNGITTRVTNLDAAIETALANTPAGDVDELVAFQAANVTFTSPTSALNQAIASLEAARDVLEQSYGIEITSSGSLVIPNIAPDEGISAPFNSWMTLFGQFFDHGLDLVNKGGYGTVFMPLQPDDPLYVAGSPTNFMVLTRAAREAGADGQFGTDDDVFNNQTTPFVDQNQTYTSHASHQVFLRAYTLENVAGDVFGNLEVPISTGELLENRAPDPATGLYFGPGSTHIGGPATWAVVKAQARELLGIELTDADVANVPLLATDEYGRFLRGANGLPQVVMQGNVLVEGNLATPISVVNALRTGHAFLDDIAHAAAPGGGKIADADSIAGGSLDTPAPGTYDDELLDRHYITGDGRGNENIGLTAVHHVFHSEHNRLAESIKELALSTNNLDFLNEWLLVDRASLPTTQNQINNLVWDGERLFQAARFGTEMQYQHLVFEEFARKVNPAVDLFVFNPTMDINPAIFAEFAHVVYRFGHSMLNETVDRLAADGQTNDDIELFDAFLNPVEFTKDGTLTAEQAAGEIIRGMTRQRGNEIDEFVTDVLRNRLVGLPLDLATLNIARGRDTGIPSLNEMREDLFAMTRSEWLKPYDNWIDFARALKNPTSIVNFIAAYGTHAALVGGFEDKRLVAWDLVMGEGAFASGAGALDRDAFLDGTGVYAASLGGLNDVDLWVGGLAESILPFGGMLGSTFTAIFEKQLENLQNGDRFYYLSRTQGLHFLTELENNSFAKIIQHNTDIGEGGPHVPGEIFANVEYTLEVNQFVQTDYNGAASGKDPLQDDDILGALENKVARGTNVTVDGNVYANQLKFTGGEHVVLGGSNDSDVLIGDLGDDHLWGDGGDDLLIGGHGINRLHGGDGDDIIFDGGDPSFIHGEGGNDAISGGNGLGELIFAGDGHDFVIAGIDGKEVFAAQGNDFVLGTPDVDVLLGGEGDDWLEGGEGFDTTAGDNSELFFNSAIIGHDVMFAGSNEHDFDAESGDDIMVQGESVMRNEGMLGFDWVSFQDHQFGANADMRIKIFTNVAADILRNRFDRVEAMSGSAHSDILVGDDRVSAEGVELNPFLPANEQTLDGDGLNAEGVARIDGLDDVLGALAPTGNALFDSGNILLGGDGSDVITGGGGNDVIDGDKYLKVRIAILDDAGVEIGTADRIQGIVTSGDPLLDGKQLDDLVFTRKVNPGNLSIVREILNSTDEDADGDYDTAVFSGNASEYTVTLLSGGTINGTAVLVDTVLDLANLAGDVLGRVRVEHTAALGDPGIVNDGTDTLENIERLQFGDTSFDLVGGLNAAPAGQPDLVAITINVNGEPVELFQVGLPVRVATTSSGALLGVTDGDNPLPDRAITNFTVTWQIEDGAGSGVFIDLLDATGTIVSGTQIVIPNDPLAPFEGESLRAVISYIDGHGVREVVTTAPTPPVAGAPNLIGTAGADLLVGTNRISLAVLQAQGFAAFADLVGNGNDTIDGLGGDDEIHGLSGNDTLLGGEGDDLIFGGGHNDILNGGAGSDILDGGLGNDTAVFGLAANDPALTAELTPFGTVEIIVGADEDELINIETVDFDGDQLSIADVEVDLAGVNRLGTGIDTFTGTAADEVVRGLGGNDVISGAGGDDLLLGDDGDDTLNGNGGADILNGGAGSDTLNGGAGADQIFMDAAENGTSLDTINGGGGLDELHIAGDDTLAETFTIAANGAVVEIRRSVNGGPSTLIASVDDVEDLIINTRGIGPGATDARGDTIVIQGNFGTTDLALNTIHIFGTGRDDTIDISGLSSQHRFVFHHNGGNVTFVGTVRPQDKFVFPDGTVLSNVEATDNGDGSTTFAIGTMSVTIEGEDAPSFATESTLGAVTESTFSLTASDLEGLRALVKGEAPAGGDDDIPTGPRTLSGEGNNVDNPEYGAADTPFIRITDARYGEDGAVNPIFANLDPRAISNAIGAQEPNLAKQADGGNIFFMAFGQYVDHGLDFILKGNNGKITIGNVDPQGPPTGTDPIDLTRATVDGLDANGVPQHINKTSNFIDQNQAYGSNDDVGKFLREPDGDGKVGAKLFFGGPDPDNADFDLLPTLRQLLDAHITNGTKFSNGKTILEMYPALKSTGVNGVYVEAEVAKLASDFMGSSHPLLLDTNRSVSLLDHIVAGDGRANENISLTAVHTIWARNHNYHVENLIDHGFAGTPEEIYQAAKMINEAEYQRVVFTEFTDKLLGGMKGSGSHGHDKYNPDADPGISHEFAAAAYRFGHSLVSQNLTVLDGNGGVTDVPLLEAFLNPGDYAARGANAIIGGIVTQAAEEVDVNIVNAVRNDLVRQPADLFAFNVARGRDVGLGTLNQVRTMLSNSTDPYIREALEFAGDLSAYEDWEDFKTRNNLSATVTAQFIAAYPDLVLEAADIAGFRDLNPDVDVTVRTDGKGVVKGIDRVDLWVGGLAEAHINDGMVGQTFWVILHEQFDRLQEADRFYYTDRFDNFDFYETHVDGQSFADIVERNTGLSLDEDIFSADQEDGANDGEDGGDDAGAGDGDTDGGVDDGDTDNDDDDDAGAGNGSGNGNGTGTGTPAVIAAITNLGTSGADMVVGYAGDDALGGDAGDDTIYGRGGHDSISAGSGDDQVFDDAGNNVIAANAGDDRVFTGGGNDIVTGGEGDDVLWSGAGQDIIFGDEGRDVVDAGDGNDMVFATKGDGSDVYEGGLGFDTIDYSQITTNLTVDLSGQVGYATTGTEEDTVSGFEKVRGGAGQDTFIAGDAVNIFEGGAGFDTFEFRTAAAAKGDTINGFQTGDTIKLAFINEDDVSVISSNVGFTTFGQLKINVVGGDTVIEGNVHGDGASDFSLTVTGRTDITAADLDFTKVA